MTALAFGQATTSTTTSTAKAPKAAAKSGGTRTVELTVTDTMKWWLAMHTAK